MQGRKLWIYRHSWQCVASVLVVAQCVRPSSWPTVIFIMTHLRQGHSLSWNTPGIWRTQAIWKSAKSCKWWRHTSLKSDFRPYFVGIVLNVWIFWILLQKATIITWKIITFYIGKMYLIFLVWKIWYRQRKFSLAKLSLPVSNADWTTQVTCQLYPVIIGQRLFSNAIMNNDSSLLVWKSSYRQRPFSRDDTVSSHFLKNTVLSHLYDHLVGTKRYCFINMGRKYINPLFIKSSKMTYNFYCLMVIFEAIAPKYVDNSIFPHSNSYMSLAIPAWNLVFLALVLQKSMFSW